MSLKIKKVTFYINGREDSYEVGIKNVREIDFTEDGTGNNIQVYLKDESLYFANIPYVLVISSHENIT